MLQSKISQEQSSASKLPTLEILDSEAHQSFTQPVKRIHEGNDVLKFLTSLAYRDIGIFVMQLNHALCPRHQSESPVPISFPLTTERSSTPSIQSLLVLLSGIEALISEAPPDPGPRRFGNVSFRKWHTMLEEQAGKLFEESRVADSIPAVARDEVLSYLLGSFGSAQRLDYGTGHELSFVAFLGCLWKLGYFKDAKQGGPIEREIVLEIFETYLHVVRKLILTYTLEPAGSHGVWGLDDHSFMPYIFGSAQFTRPINDGDPTPLEGSVRGAPKPSDVTSAEKVDDYRHSNMYFSAIGFINDVKKGPFWEHSPILFDISGIRDGWGKINKGMIKMFNAEVLSKFPVVQHFHFGSLFSWDVDPDAAAPTQSMHMANQPPAVPGVQVQTTGGNAAPWSQPTQTPSVSGRRVTPATRAPVAGSMPQAHPRTQAVHPPAVARPESGPSADAQVTMTKAPWAK